MSCTKRNPQPPCNEDSHVENRNGKECCYKGKKKTSPKKNTVSYDLKKSLDKYISRPTKDLTKYLSHDTIPKYNTDDWLLYNCLQDGSCFYHAIMCSLKLLYPEYSEIKDVDFKKGFSYKDHNKGSTELRKFLAKYIDTFGEELDSKDKKDMKKRLLEKSNDVWARDEEIRFTSKVLGICIGVYADYGHAKEQWQIFSPNYTLDGCSRIIFLYNTGIADKGFHYDCIIPKELVKSKLKVKTEVQEELTDTLKKSIDDIIAKENTKKITIKYVKEQLEELEGHTLDKYKKAIKTYVKDNSGNYEKKSTKNKKKTNVKLRITFKKLKKTTCKKPPYDLPCRDTEIERKNEHGDTCCYDKNTIRDDTDNETENIKDMDYTRLLDPKRYNQLIGYYNSLGDCITNSKNNSKPYPLTNYKFDNNRVRFDHLYYHAGDWEDIERYGLLPLRITETKDYKGKKKSDISPIYKDYNLKSVYDTFKYIFFHLKKAIFVSIRDSKLNMFLPFSNANYINPFVERLYFDKDDSDLLKKMKKSLRLKENIDKINEAAQKKVDEYSKSVGLSLDNKRHKWIVNNCNIRAPKKGNVEGEHGTNVYKDLLEQMCENVKDIPDCEFFINVRDFPILRNDLREPYNHLYDITPNYIPKKYQNKPFAPIFSASTTEEFADVLMPNVDDWSRVSDKHYLDWKEGCYKTPEINSNTPWDKKINKVIFRGSATGCGITIKTNIRLRAAALGKKYPNILDLGIVDWNARPKKFKKQPIRVIDEEKFNFKLKPRITDEEKFKYKYILYLDGHVAAFRMGGELASGSVLFVPESSYSLWFSKHLEPMKHYIPIKDDLSDLVEKTNWCIKNDSVCKEIADNALQFYKTHLTKEKILEYFADSLKNIGFLRSKGTFLGEDTPKKNLKNIALVTIYRDSEDGSRKIQKDHFLEIMPKLFKNKANLSIILVEQNKGDLFNIGKLKNIGFDIANKSGIDFSHIIFTDIDVIPNTELMHYYLTKPVIPTALAIEGTRYHSRKKNDGKPFMGAACAFTMDQFKKINGYSNAFYGWGGEDTNLALKIHEAGMKIGYPEKGAIIDLEEKDNKSISLENKVKVVLKEKKEKLAYEKMAVIKNNGISNLNYKIIKQTKYNRISSKITHIIVNLLKKDDENNKDWFPNTFNEDERFKYKRDMQKIKWKIQNV